MMMVIEEGISTKSLIISVVSTVLGIGSMIWFLDFTRGKGLAINLACVLVTLILLVVGMMAWMGYFDKKLPPNTPPKPEGFKPEPIPKVNKIKPVEKEDWADKWMKEKIENGTGIRY